VAGLTGAWLAARLGVARLLVLTNAVATAISWSSPTCPRPAGTARCWRGDLRRLGTDLSTAFGAMVTASRGVADGDQASSAG
jgi:hypothetical protein